MYNSTVISYKTAGHQSFFQKLSRGGTPRPSLSAGTQNLVIHIKRLRTPVLQSVLS